MSSHDSRRRLRNPLKRTIRNIFIRNPQSETPALVGSDGLSAAPDPNLIETGLDVGMPISFNANVTPVVIGEVAATPGIAILGNVETSRTEIPRPENASTGLKDFDSSQTIARYEAAVNKLKAAIKKRWIGFESGFDSIEDVAILRTEIAKTMEARAKASQLKSPWLRSKAVMEQLFFALSPLAINVLTISKGASNIPGASPYGLVASGLMALITIAETELRLKEEIEKTLDYIYRQLGQLRIINDLPNCGVPTQELRNRAVDVKSNVMVYIAVHLGYESSHTSIGAKVVVTFFGGDQERRGACQSLENTIQEYNSALSHFGHSVGFKIFSCVQDIQTALVKVNSLFETQKATQPVLIHFMMPYDKNEQFTGRDKLLKTLRQRLCETAPKQWSHRVALYGMGGIGKTQSAIQYVYANRKNYDKIFWISGATEDSLLSGYMEIATGTKCVPVRQDSNPPTIAKFVLAWLREQTNWLVVIDNLDDVTVAKDYLPERAPDKHTLITTRNPNAKGIPARGLEVPLPDLEESTEMLCTLSDMDMESNLVEAQTLVKELAYLPLAIDQAASYVYAVTRSFSVFLNFYQKRRIDLHKWLPEGNRQYSHSVATTWSVSFDFIKKEQPQTAKLLQVLAFLNPDVVFIDFLTNAKDAFDSELHKTISDSMNFATALLSLEKFSLVKWSRESNALSMHRLIQAVVKDEMAEKYMVWCMTTVVEMCDVAFPKDFMNENRPLCRRYNNQVVVPLLNVAKLRTSRTAEVALRIGDFLAIDAKYEEGRQLCTMAVEIFTEIYGNEDGQALNAMVSLAECQWRHGRLNEAATLLSEAIAIGQRVLGEDNPNTLRAMRHLGMTYWYQGKREEAVEVQKKTLLLRKKVLGSEHPETLNAMDHLGLALNSLEDWDEAVAVQEETVSLKTKVLGAEHPSTLNAAINLSGTYRDSGMKPLSEVARLQEETLEIIERVLGEESPSMPEIMTDLGVTYRLLGRADEAAEMHERAAVIGKRILGADHQHVLNTLHRLAQDYHHQGRIEEAIQLCENVVSRMCSRLGENHHKTEFARKTLQIMQQTIHGVKARFDGDILPEYAKEVKTEAVRKKQVEIVKTSRETIVVTEVAEAA